MSMPRFPEYDPCLTREQALNGILSSIAMEELALSHIINAEGEKLQYLMREPCGRPCGADDLLAVNKSVASLMGVVMQTQMLLRSKMESVLDALPPPPCPHPCPPHPCPPHPCPPPCPHPHGPDMVFLLENFYWRPSCELPLRRVHPPRPDGNDAANHTRIVLPPKGKYAVDFRLSVKNPPAFTVRIDASRKDAAVEPRAFRFFPDCDANNLTGAAIVATPLEGDTELCFVLLASRSVQLCRARLEIRAL